MTHEAGMVSLIVPVYNEAGRIRAFVPRILQAAGGYPGRVEVLFVDDGSSDETLRLLTEATAGDARSRILSHAVNQGKGKAIATGVSGARGEFVVFSDLDLSVPLSFLPEFVTALREGADVALGSRHLPGARIEIHQPWYREAMGRVFRHFTRLILLPGRSDFTCGFKAFRAEAARDLFGSLTIPRWGFDVEILFLAQHRGYSIIEIPVAWSDSKATTVRLGRDVLGSLREVLSIRWNAWRRMYDRPREG